MGDGERCERMMARSSADRCERRSRGSMGGSRTLSFSLELPRMTSPFFFPFGGRAGGGIGAPAPSSESIASGSSSPSSTVCARLSDLDPSAESNDIAIESSRACCERRVARGGMSSSEVGLREERSGEGR